MRDGGAAIDALRAAGARCSPPNATLPAALERWRSLGVRSVLLEGGAALHAAAWDEGLVDYRAAVRDARTSLGADGVPLLAGRRWSLSTALHRAPRRAARTRRPDRRICSRASLKPSARWRDLKPAPPASGCASDAARAGAAPGDSLAVNGVCLTVIAREPAARCTPTSAPRRCASRRSGRCATAARQPRAAAARRQPLRRPLRAGARRRHGQRRRASARTPIPLADGVLPAALAPLIVPQGLDRGRRHQPDGRGPRTQSRSTCRSSRSPGRTRTCASLTRSATASISNATWSASTWPGAAAHAERRPTEVASEPKSTKNMRIAKGARKQRAVRAHRGRGRRHSAPAR